MVNLVALDVELVDDVVLEKGEVGVPNPMLDVAALTRKQVVQAVDDVALPHECINKVGADKASTTRNENAALKRRRRNEGSA